MALQVKLVQKVGQTSMSAGVTAHLKEGWQPYGSPYVAYEAAGQVMFLPDDATPAPNAEYALVSKYGLITVGEQVLERLADGWNMFGEPFTTQYGPTHAMTKGDFTIFMPNLGFGEGGGGTGGGGITEAEVQALIDAAIAAIELPAEDQWKAYVDKGDQDTLQAAGETAINSVNSLREEMELKDSHGLDAAKAYTDEAILALPGNPDWQTNIDKGDQETLAAAQTYVDDQIAGIPPPPMYNWQLEIDHGDGETLNTSKNYTDTEIAKIPVKDWAGDFTRIEQNIDELYNVVNSTPDPQASIDKAKAEAIAHTDTEVSGVRSEFTSADAAVLVAAKSYADAQDKVLKGQSETYADNMVEYGMGQMQGQISAGTAYATQYTDQEIQKLDGAIDNRMSDLNQNMLAGDVNTLDAAKAYADGLAASAKDWQPEITAGDAATAKAAELFAEAQTDNAVKTLKTFAEALVEAAETASTKLLNETMEAGLLGALARWEADDKRDRDYVTVAHLTGNYTSELNDGLSPVTLQANDNGTSRTTYALRPASEYPDGFVKHVYNSTGSETSEEWGSSVRVHLSQEDYDAGFMMRGPLSSHDFSAVIKPNGFGVFVLDKAKKIWFFSGVNIVKNSSKVPTSRIPAGDLPEGELPE